MLFPQFASFWTHCKASCCSPALPRRLWTLRAELLGLAHCCYPWCLREVWHVTLNQQQIFVEGVKCLPCILWHWIILFPPIYVRALFQTLVFLPRSILCNFSQNSVLFFFSLYSLASPGVVWMHVALRRRSLESIALAQSFSKIPDGYLHALSVRLISKFQQHLKVKVPEMSSLLRTDCFPKRANGGMISWGIQLTK